MLKWILIAIICFLLGYIGYLKEFGCPYNATVKTDTTYAHTQVIVHDIPKPIGADSPTIWPNHSHIPTSGGMKTQAVYYPIEQKKGWLKRLFTPKKVESDDDQRTSFYFTPVDTVAIVNAYFARVFYADTLKDKYSSVIIFDTLSENRILGRSARFSSDIPTVTTRTILTPKPHPVVFAGFDLGTGLGVNAALLTPKQNLLSAHLFWNFRETNLILTYDKKIKF